MTNLTGDAPRRCDRQRRRYIYSAVLGPFNKARGMRTYTNIGASIRNSVFTRIIARKESYSKEIGRAHV